MKKADIIELINLRYLDCVNAETSKDCDMYYGMCKAYLDILCTYSDYEDKYIYYIEPIIIGYTDTVTILKVKENIELKKDERKQFNDKVIEYIKTYVSYAMDSMKSTSSELILERKYGEINSILSCFGMYKGYRKTYEYMMKRAEHVYNDRYVELRIGL